MTKEDLDKLLNQKVFSIIKPRVGESIILQFNTFYCLINKKEDYDVSVTFSNTENLNENLVGATIKSIIQNESKCDNHYLYSFKFYYKDNDWFNVYVCSRNSLSIKFNIYPGFYKKQLNDYVFVEDLLA